MLRQLQRQGGERPPLANGGIANGRWQYVSAESQFSGCVVRPLSIALQLYYQKGKVSLSETPACELTQI